MVFINTYERNYDTIDEYSDRRGVFIKNLRTILAMNQTLPTSTVDVNMFTDLTQYEF